MREKGDLEYGLFLKSRHIENLTIPSSLAEKFSQDEQWKSLYAFWRA